MPEHKYTNKLLQEKSPYLLQHAHNPVDWYPWGPEAFSRAIGEDKPIFLSIGYSTCHWCHVMERESFEDEEVARVLNKHFISIKVDREERPDIDHIYMSVCQALTGSGGWPLTVILTPDKKPFYAGTYFPKSDRMGMPGLLSILDRVINAWKKDKNSITGSADKITGLLNEALQQDENETQGLSEDIVHEAYENLKHFHDSTFGGFSRSPKFPTPHNLLFLLRYWYQYREPSALEMVEKTLNSMYRGGIFDHIGYGFSRYSTDNKWLVPHFEKMLYDNALLAISYIEAYQATKNLKYSRVAEKIFDYVLRTMHSENGAFYSAEDADSEGVEGKFYLWTYDEILQVLGSDEGKKFSNLYGIIPNGNFEGKNIPNLLKSDLRDEDFKFVEACRTKLFDYREKRIHPYKDDKVLTSWNSLMCAALAIGARVLQNSKYLDAAESSVSFLLENMIMKSDGRLMARFRDGDTAHKGYADDYAFLIWALIELYQTTFKVEYLSKAVELTDSMIQLFWDNENGGFYIYGSDSEKLITRPKEVYDGAIPSANSVAAMNCIRLYHLTGHSRFIQTSEKLFNSFGGSVKASPMGHSFFLSSVLFSISSTKEVVILDNNFDTRNEFINAINKSYNPFTTVIYAAAGDKETSKVIPFIDSYKTVNGKTSAYICENHACQEPVVDVNSFINQFEKPEMPEIQ